jgi:ZIP family zinc transporter/zinc and cadmium transporter
MEGQMGSRYLLLLALGLAASLANIAGGLIVSSQDQIRRTFLNALISLGAGFMLSATILEVLPRSLQLNEGAAAIILAGYLFVHLVEHTIASHFHFGEETHREEVLDARAAYSALAGLVLHAFFDGALIAAGFWISMHLGILMFVAIVLHKIPEGFTAASIMRASGRGKRAAAGAALAISFSTLAGVLSISYAQVFVRLALPFSAGVTLYVAASDLIPEVNKERGVSVSAGVFLGVVFFFLTETLLSMAL